MPVYRDRRACPLARPLPVAEARMRRGCRPGPVRHGFGTMEVRIAEYAVPSDQRIRSERDMMIAYQFEGSRRSKVLAQNQGSFFSHADRGVAADHALAFEYDGAPIFP